MDDKRTSMNKEECDYATTKRSKTRNARSWKCITKLPYWQVQHDEKHTSVETIEMEILVL